MFNRRDLYNFTGHLARAAQTWVVKVSRVSFCFDMVDTLVSKACSFPKNAILYVFDDNALLYWLSRGTWWVCCCRYVRATNSPATNMGRATMAKANRIIALEKRMLFNKRLAAELLQVFGTSSRGIVRLCVSL